MLDLYWESSVDILHRFFKRIWVPEQRCKKKSNGKGQVSKVGFGGLLCEVLYEIPFTTPKVITTLGVDSNNLLRQFHQTLNSRRRSWNGILLIFDYFRCVQGRWKDKWNDQLFYNHPTYYISELIPPPIFQMGSFSESPHVVYTFKLIGWSMHEGDDLLGRIPIDGEYLIEF